MRKKRISISIFQIFIAIIVIVAIVIAVVLIRKNTGSEKIETTPKEVKQIGQTKEFEILTGRGTIEEPYKIEKIEDLIKLARNVNNGRTYSNEYFELTDTLDFQNDESYNKPNGKYWDVNKDGKVESIKTELTTGLGFEAIGNSEECPFEGIFKGNNKVIRNLYSSIKNEKENILIGLFGNNKGTISNLKVTGNITLDENLENKKIYIGMVCAKNAGVVQACNTEGEININNNGSNNNIQVAGVVAENTGKITDTVNNVNIISSNLKAGIVAKNLVVADIEDSGEIINCTNSGSIKENTPSTYYTAGIVAENLQGNITSCNNNGEIIGKYAGGIVGKATGYIVACQNTGTINNVQIESDDTEIAGGIVGLLDTAKIENCKNTGNVVGLTNAGGIVGENRGTITQSRNEGNVSKIDGVATKTVNSGGIAGKNSPNAKIINSKNFGSITSGADIVVSMGGICGVLYNTSIIENCENNGGLRGAAQTINPNEDLNDRVSSCTSNNGGNADIADFGELNIGLIYGKFEEK